MSDARDAEIADLRAEIATLRGLLAEARPSVKYNWTCAEYREQTDWVAAYRDLLARIDAALSPAVPTRHTTSPGADAGAGPDSGSKEER